MMVMTDCNLEGGGRISRGNLICPYRLRKDFQSLGFALGAIFILRIFTTG